MESDLYKLEERYEKRLETGQIEYPDRHKLGRHPHTPRPLQGRGGIITCATNGANTLESCAATP
jgi:hypothetical protein